MLGELEAQNAASPLMHYLEGYGPDDWPRGRVVWNTGTKKFEVYLEKQLRTPQFEKWVLLRFHLTTEKHPSSSIQATLRASFLVLMDRRPVNCSRLSIAALSR
jgi:hypothetical protein